MNREEIKNSRAYQVSKAALEYYNEHYQNKDIDLTDAFEAGAKWADENPNNGKELLYVANQTAERTKKEIISKAYKWLEKELFTDPAEPNPYYATDVKSKSYDTKEDFLFEFRKAMES